MYTTRVLMIDMERPADRVHMVRQLRQRQFQCQYPIRTRETMCLLLSRLRNTLQTLQTADTLGKTLRGNGATLRKTVDGEGLHHR